MGKNRVSTFTKFIYVLFGIGTIISLFIVYKDLDNSISINFMMGYLFFTFFLILYVLLITVINARKYNWADIKGRLSKFIAWFILFGALNYAFDYFLRPSDISVSREFSIALGLAFGISFYDITILKKS